MTTLKLPNPTFVDESKPVPTNAALQVMHEAVERVLVQGDLSKLSVDERNFYYKELCTSLGLNHLTRPFEYLTLSGKLTLYPRKDCTDQLRALHKITVTDVNIASVGDMYVVTTKVANAEGRTDMSTGVVSLGTAKGDLLANLMMKAETKSKRRATLSICGLGMFDESEVETIPGAQRAIPAHDPSTGELDDELPGDLGPPDSIEFSNTPEEYDSPRSTPVTQAADEVGAATGTDHPPPNAAPAKPVPYSKYVQDLETAAEGGREALHKAWLLIPPGRRVGNQMEQVLRTCQKRAHEVDKASKAP